jgi:hypothetical protein
MDVKAFNLDVSAMLQELRSSNPSGFVYINSIKNREKTTSAGTVCEVGLETAARRLCEHSAVRATPAEIEEYQARCRENRAQIVAAGKRHLNQELRISVDQR